MICDTSTARDAFNTYQVPSIAGFATSCTISSLYLLHQGIKYGCELLMPGKKKYLVAPKGRRKQNMAPVFSKQGLRLCVQQSRLEFTATSRYSYQLGREIRQTKLKLPHFHVSDTCVLIQPDAPVATAARDYLPMYIWHGL